MSENQGSLRAVSSYELTREIQPTSANLFAACRIKGKLVAKHVPTNAEVQGELISIFRGQEDMFREGVTTEIDFDGSWKPDEDELLFIPVPAEAEIFKEAVDSNTASVDEIETQNFAEEGIKALFMGISGKGETRILVQRFTSHQILDRKFLLHLWENAFRRLEDTAFTLDTNLTCIIEEGLIKFKSQHKLRSIIDLREIYREATDQEVKDFAKHPKLHIADTRAFLDAANQPSRKLIKAVLSDETLDKYETKNIRTAAKKTGLEINVRGGKIVMPSESKDIRALLQFLTEGRYLGPLSGQAYISNSHRPAD